MATRKKRWISWLLFIAAVAGAIYFCGGIYFVLRTERHHFANTEEAVAHLKFFEHELPADATEIYASTRIFDISAVTRARCSEADTLRTIAEHGLTPEPVHSWSVFPEGRRVKLKNPLFASGTSTKTKRHITFVFCDGTVYINSRYRSAD